MIGPLVPLETDDAGLCDSQWGSNKCPNRAEFILFNLDNAGFAIMCGPHKEGYLAERGGTGVDVWIYDPDVVRDLTESAKAAGLI